MGAKRKARREQMVNRILSAHQRIDFESSQREQLEKLVKYESKIWANFVSRRGNEISEESITRLRLERRVAQLEADVAKKHSFWRFLRGC